MSILPYSFIFLLLLPPVLIEAKRRPGEEEARHLLLSAQPAQRPRNRSVPRSGQLTTKGGHRCTWQTSGEVLVNLLVNCSTDTPGDQQRYWCRYAGKPDLCLAYGVKSSQYWKQLVEKVKKRHNACEGEKVLKAKICKRAPTDAHMKLFQSSREDRRAGKRRGLTAGRSSDGGKGERKKGEEEERSFEEEGVVNDMEPVQSYCSDGWRSVCSVFVKIFEG